MKMLALTSTQGTAMGETAICDTHPEADRDILKRLAHRSGDWDHGDFHDCSGNEALTCQMCGATVEPEMVTFTFTWSNEHGMCDDCGDLPANYFAPDLVITNVTDPANPVVVTGQKLCPICAALWASHGERLERLWKDDSEEEEA